MKLIDADALIYVLTKRKNVLEKAYGADDKLVKCIDGIIEIVELQKEIDYPTI